MGYTTDFFGEVTIDPPLNPQEIAYLHRFSESRRMHRAQGPYYANPGNNRGQSGTEILDYNAPPQQQPDLWCHWVPTEDGSAICWNGAEKFYGSAEWMAYLIDTFLKPGATVQQEMRALATAGGTTAPALRQAQDGWVYPAEFAAFTFNHTVNGEIDASGEDPDDIWRLVVRDNVVSIQSGQITFAHETVLGGDTSPVQATATRMDQPSAEQPALTAGRPALAAATTP
ncbi:hypothetical protein [Amycolatopsis magusensis]|uniref:hypothetical protein n=1 Tax=Amycolatopsis magusensis TaxID=882444 RepID=UPI0037B000FE